MNVKLSCAVNRKLSKNAYVIEQDGRPLDSDVFTCRSNNLKVEAIEAVRRGLLNVRRFVTHNDILTIEVHNQHLASWINDHIEAEDYYEQLIEVFAVLDTIDCRYYARVVETSSAMNLAKTGEVKKIKLVDVLDGLD